MDSLSLETAPETWWVNDRYPLSWVIRDSDALLEMVSNIREFAQVHLQLTLEEEDLRNVLRFVQSIGSVGPEDRDLFLRHRETLSMTPVRLQRVLFCLEWYMDFPPNLRMMLATLEHNGDWAARVIYYVQSRTEQRGLYRWMIEDLRKASPAEMTPHMLASLLVSGISWKFGDHSDMNVSARLTDDQIQRWLSLLVEKSCPRGLSYTEWCRIVSSVLHDVDQDPRKFLKTREAKMALLVNNHILLQNLGSEVILDTVVQILTPEQMTAQYRIFGHKSTREYFDIE